MTFYYIKIFMQRIKAFLVSTSLSSPLSLTSITMFRRKKIVEEEWNLDILHSIQSRTIRIYLDGRIVRPIIKPRPSFGYFSTDNLQYNTLGCWVTGMIVSLTKRLKFQMLFLFIISCKNLSYLFLNLQKIKNKE